MPAAYATARTTETRNLLVIAAFPPDGRIIAGLKPPETPGDRRASAQARRLLIQWLFGEHPVGLFADRTRAGSRCFRFDVRLKPDATHGPPEGGRYKQWSLRVDAGRLVAGARHIFNVGPRVRVRMRVRTAVAAELEHPVAQPPEELSVVRHEQH